MGADLSLLAAAKRMNGEAIMGIFDLYAPALYKYAFRLCHNAILADQIVGDAFARLIEHFAAGWDPRTNLRPYLYNIVYHIFVDEVRCSHRWAPIEAVDLIYPAENSTQINAEDRMLFETVLQAIMNDLTDHQGHVIILRFMEGFSVKETALIIGKKAGNVKMIQNRAPAVLRTALDFQMVETRTISLSIRSAAHI